MSKLSVVIPCYNEASSLRACVNRVLAIADENLSLELIIVDDGSSDNSPGIARELAESHPEVRFLTHEVNRGKGAALRTGFKAASGDFVAVQDADLEYNPKDLKRLLGPLNEGEADVVLGSRFVSQEAHRVLYFWHSMGNTLLTFLSNMYTNLNLTDMETGYKVFRREVIQSLDLKEDRFGIEPELVAKISHAGLRIYEMGISYHGRTYEEGKKIGFKDALRAFYCIVKYNAPHLPIPLQFINYVFIGGVAALVNMIVFLGLYRSGVSVTLAAPAAFAVAALTNYLLCILLIFRHKARWKSGTELLIFIALVTAIGVFDLWSTGALIAAGVSAGRAKLTATAVGLIFNYLGRRFLVFPEKREQHY